MSSNSDPTAALLLGTGAGVFLFFRGFRKFREYKIVEDTPRMPIRSVPMGLVHVRGKAQSDTLISSPITHTPCCFYQVRIEHWKSDGHGGSWERYHTDNNGSKFYLQDDTGKILVDSYSAEYDLPGSPPRVVDGERIGAAVGTGATDQELLQYVEEAGVHQFSNKIDHWLEKKGPQDDPRKEQGRQMLLQLAQGMSSLSTGGGALPADMIETFMKLRGPLPDAEKEQMRQLMLSRLQEMRGQSIPLPHLGTHMASGRYRLREFLILPGEEYNVTGTCAENPSPCDDQDRCVILKGQNEKTFLVSWETEGEIQKGLRKNAVVMVFGGAALTLVCLALLLAHLRLL
jgi:hypothetical protein